MQEYSIKEILAHAGGYASSSGFRFVMVKDENGDALQELRNVNIFHNNESETCRLPALKKGNKK